MRKSKLNFYNRDEKSGMDPDCEEGKFCRVAELESAKWDLLDLPHLGGLDRLWILHQIPKQSSNWRF
ncbi:MAG: hypothetical protein H7832_11770 [Magnetococcus sp. DMHC-6]